jgi:hypothetical protein
VKVLTLKQPWASLVARGAKRVETRSWRTPYRGPLAIHAAKGFPRECQELVYQEPFRSALNGALPSELPRSKILCVVNIVGCVSTEGLQADTPEARRCRAEYFDMRLDEWDFGDYSSGRFAWLLRGVQLVKPVEAKGALGLWEFDDSELKPLGEASEGAFESSASAAAK